MLETNIPRLHKKMEQRQREEPDSVIDADLVGAWFSIGEFDKTFYHVDQCVEKSAGPRDGTAAREGQGSCSGNGRGPHPRPP